MHFAAVVCLAHVTTVLFLLPASVSLQLYCNVAGAAPATCAQFEQHSTEECRQKLIQRLSHPLPSSANPRIRQLLHRRHCLWQRAPLELLLCRQRTPNRNSSLIPAICRRCRCSWSRWTASSRRARNGTRDCGTSSSALLSPSA